MTTHLRQRMIEDVQLRGLAERTQEMYVIVVRQLAEHYGTSPDLITEEELRQYFLYRHLVFLITPFPGMKSLEFDTLGPDTLDPY